MLSQAFAVSLLLLSTPFVSTAAVPTTTSDLPAYNVDNPGATPAHVVPFAAPIMPTASLVAAVHRIAVNRNAARAKRALDDALDVDLGFYDKRDRVAPRSIGDTVREKVWGKRQATTSLAQTTCLDSTANETVINSLFYYGGANTTVSLCPGAQIKLNNSIFFYYPGQELSTQGYPTDDTRATLIVTGSDQSNAIYGACDWCWYIKLKNIAVAGSRDTMGLINGGAALIELGGNTKGQIVDSIHAYEPRGWSVLHGIEGYQTSCRGMSITNNQIGPSGHSPTNGYQFRRRDTYAPGQWADGISLACAESTVSGNTITDATDGQIVIFGAPGSVVSGNTIISNTRNALGGINMVDYGPFGGTFEGTVVTGNTLNANTAMMKIGIALGSMSWGSDNRTASRTFGGEVHGNTFTSGSSGFFGYASSIAGHNNALVYNNDASTAAFGGTPSVACIPNPMVPTTQAFVYDQWTAPNATLQNNFNNFPLVFLICQQPGTIVARGPAEPLSSISSSASSTASSSAVSSTVSSSSAVSSSASSSALSSSSAEPSSSAAVSSAPAAAVISSSSEVATATGRRQAITRPGVSSTSSTATGGRAAPPARTALGRVAVLRTSLVERNVVPLAGERELLEERNAEAEAFVYVRPPTPTMEVVYPTL